MMDITQEILYHNWTNISSYAFGLVMPQNRVSTITGYVEYANRDTNNILHVYDNAVNRVYEFVSIFDTVLPFDSQYVRTYNGVVNQHYTELHYCIVNNSVNAGCVCASYDVPHIVNVAYLVNSMDLTGCVFCCIKHNNKIHFMHAGGDSGTTNSNTNVPLVWKRFADVYNMIKLVVFNQQVTHSCDSINLYEIVTLLNDNLGIDDRAFIAFGDLSSSINNTSVVDKTTIYQYNDALHLNNGRVLSIALPHYLGVCMMSQSQTNRDKADSGKVCELIW